jgi:hypothetical protein
VIGDKVLPEAMSTPMAKDFVAQFVGKSRDERLLIVEDAQEKLSGNQMKIFRKEIKKIQEDEKVVEEGEDEVSSEDEIRGTPSATTATTKKGKKKVNEAEPEKEIEVLEEEALAFWKELESMTGDDLLDEQVIMDFQYVGFNPNTILKSIIKRGRKSDRTNNQIKSDIAQMCTIAVIKGSITETNLKKMSDNGKKAYGVLEARYGLKKGGSKGVDPDVITIARVGAAFPGSMMRILLKRPDLAKKFSGPFGSKSLPSYLRHQSAAACIPETLEQKSKDFLLGLITAFTSDQSKVISKTSSKTKKTPPEIYEDQENFVGQTHGSNYPTPEVRKTIFKTWSLIADYDTLKSVGDNISKIVPDFTPISKADLQKSISSV